VETTAPEPAAVPPAPAPEAPAKPAVASPTGAEASAPPAVEPSTASPENREPAAEDQVPPESEVASTGDDTVEEEQAAPPAAPPADAKPGKVVVRARLESWVQVTNAKKEVMFSRVLRVGETYTVPDEKGLTLTTGNAGGIDILLDGKKLKSLGAVGLVKRDIPLDPKKLKDGTAFKPAARAD
jgi:cytoskeleton protein RodZ